MVAIVRLEGYEKLAYMRNFLKKQPEDEQETIAIQTVIRCKVKILCFKFAQRGV